jgi:predicted GNAT family acetyltransferase
VIFTHENVHDIWQEVLPLAHKHWLELEQNEFGQGFNPDVKRYAQLQDMGMYFHFCGRDNGKLVASAGIYITPSMHSQRLIAQEDTFYMLPEYRGRGRNIIRFVEFTERFARSKGAAQFLLTTPITNTASERVVAHMGYTQITKGWAKTLNTQSEQKVA